MLCFRASLRATAYREPAKVLSPLVYGKSVGFLKKLLGKDKEEAVEAPPGIELRRMALTTTAEQLGISPSEEYPRLYAAIMDFPVGQHIFTLFANTAGDVSLYSTSTFGIIGGGQHENVRQAGSVWLKAMSDEIDLAKPTTDLGHGRTRSCEVLLPNL